MVLTYLLITTRFNPHLTRAGRKPAETPGRASWEAKTQNKKERTRDMRYYSTERPLAPGIFPRKDGTERITNFDDKIFCEEIQREAWGFVEYKAPLAPEEVARYELVPGGSDSCILVGQDGTGRTVAFVK